MDAIDVVYYDIAITMEMQAIHILNNEVLLFYLQQPDNGALELADFILEQYEERFGVPLQVGRHSLAIEILAHVFADKFADSVQRLADRLDDKYTVTLQKLVDKIKLHSDVIDCGEMGRDNDRLLWDLISPFHVLVYTACGDNA